MRKRREPRLRQARDWFFANCFADTLDEAMRIAPPGTEAGTNFRYFRRRVILNCAESSSDARRVDYAETVSGHPIAVSLLNASMERWRFKRFLRNGTAVRACNRVTLKFSIVEGHSTVEAVTSE